VTTNSLRSNGDNIYRARTAGTTGGAGPTHLSGEVSDGSITWAYCASRQRGLYDRQKPWSSGQTVTTGERRYNGARIYEATTSGTTGNTAPVHTSTSAVSDGSVSWLLVRTVPSDFASTGNVVEGVIGFGNAVDEILDRGTGNIIRTRTRIDMRVPGREILSSVFADASDPAGLISAQPGSLFLRRSGNLSPKTAYLKVSGTGTAGWLPIALRSFGATSLRPTSEMTSGSEGFEYFDTDLGIPIWWKGSGWVNSAGATI
jgi:hypothetical protein